MIILSLIVLSIAAFSSENKSKEETTKIDISNKNSVVQSAVIAEVYVQPPNFDVLDEKNENIITLIKEAETPKLYKGTLIKLKSDDLSQIKKVIINLGIDEVIIYHKDIKIAKELIDSGFNIAIK